MLDISRFVKVLPLAGSTVDGEASAALCTAHKMLRTANLSFTDMVQSMESGVPISGGGDELARLRVELADAVKLIRAYQKELDQLRAHRSRSAGGTLKRTRAEITATMHGIFKESRLSQFSDREIARRTGLSPQTVGNWRRRIEAERTSKGQTVHNGRRRAA
jgi:Homeodomain-like domain